MHPHSADHSEFVPVRSSSPVLMSSNPIPLHMQSLLEDDRESLSSLNTTPSSTYISQLHGDIIREKLSITGIKNLKKLIPKKECK